MVEPNAPRTFTVKVQETTTKAVLVRIQKTGMELWLPRKVVEFPANVARYDVLDVDIPGWLISSKIGNPDH